MGHGGARPGAGKKKGTKWKSTLSKDQIRQHVQRRVCAALDELLDAQIANAQGIKYLVARDPKTGKFERIEANQVNPDIHIEVWEKDPSVQAFTDLLNRAADKPKEQAQDLNITGSLDIVQVLKQRHARAQPRE